MSLGLVQNVELGDDVLFLRGQAAHQIRQPEGGYGFFLRRWTGRSKLVVCRQQALIGILPTGSERGCLCFLVIGKPWRDTLKPYTQGDIMELRRGDKKGREIQGRI